MKADLFEEHGGGADFSTQALGCISVRGVCSLYLTSGFYGAGSSLQRQLPLHPL